MAYARLQRFKDVHAYVLPPIMREELDVEVRRQITAAGLAPSEHSVAAAFNGMAWVAALLYRHELPLRPVMEIPEDIVRNTLANLHDSSISPPAVRLGVGAGYFTGLGHGLELAKPSY